ncbi:hypothetical protein RQP46_004416 [Phenoliferia psychrophenolica]
MIVHLVGARLKTKPTAATRMGLKGLCLVDNVYRTLAQPYLFQAVQCRGVPLDETLSFSKEVLPRFYTNVTSLLFQRNNRTTFPTKAMRQAVSRITGTTQADRDGEECFSALIAAAIPLLPHLTSVAFDFHARQPRSPDRIEGCFFHSRAPVEKPKTKPRADNPDLVLAPLLAIASQITSLDICLDECPQSDYSALADFLAAFRKLRTLRLADPPETRGHRGHMESFNRVGRSRLFSVINSLQRLRSLSFVHLTELMDDLILRAVPAWTLKLKSLTIIEADGLSIESLLHFIDSFAATLESLTLSQCPRSPAEPYIYDPEDSDDEECDDEYALESLQLELVNLRSLTLGHMFVGPEVLDWFVESPLETATMGCCAHFDPDDYFRFMEDHQDTLKTVKLRLHPGLLVDYANLLCQDARNELDIECTAADREPEEAKRDEDFTFHWPMDVVYA